MEKTQFVFPLIGVVGILSLVGIMAFSVAPSKSYEDYKKAKEVVIEEPTKEKVGDYELETITYNGHKYLFVKKRKHSNLGGILHDPDCPCKKSE